MSGGGIIGGSPSALPKNWADEVPDPNPVTGRAEVAMQYNRGRVVIRYQASSVTMPVDVVLPLTNVKQIAAAVLMQEAQTQERIALDQLRKKTT